MYPLNNPQCSIFQLRKSSGLSCQHVVYDHMGHYSCTFHLLPCSSESETAESCADVEWHLLLMLLTRASLVDFLLGSEGGDSSKEVTS